MSEQYTFRGIEQIAATAHISSPDVTGGDFINADYRVTFDCLISNPPPSLDTSSLLDIEGQDDVRNLYLHNVLTPGFTSSGILTFSDYSFFENCALPIDVFRREAITGEPLCWGVDFATWYANQHNLDAVLDRNLSRNYIDVILRELRSHSVHGQAIVLSAPGQEIYGHWLLDIIPRLHVLNLGPYDDLPIYLNNMPAWASYFLDALDIDATRISPNPARFFKVESAIVPTSSKSGYRLGERSLKAAWSRIEDAYMPPDIAPELVGQKVFLSRRKLAHNVRPSPANMDEVEKILIRRGYSIIAPETLSIAQQIFLMKECRIVVGEDGSALHNIIFGSPGMRLGVLTLPERTNLWHMGICQILNHSVAYYSIPGETCPVDIKSFNAFIDALEN